MAPPDHIIAPRRQARSGPSLAPAAQRAAAHLRRPRRLGASPPPETSAAPHRLAATFAVPATARTAASPVRQPPRLAAARPTRSGRRAPPLSLHVVPCYRIRRLPLLSRQTPASSISGDLGNHALLQCHWLDLDLRQISVDFSSLTLAHMLMFIAS